MPNTLLILTSAMMLVLQPLSAVTMDRLFSSGELLRCHVVAHDDTEEMQRVKLCVRDAVADCWVENTDGGTMLQDAGRILPQLAAAAQEAARREGFSGPVSVAIERRTFPESQSGRLHLPAGEYPALMIRLGSAQGHNWWGLLDPALSRWMACMPGTETKDGFQWDWTPGGLWTALFGSPLKKGA